MNLLDFMSVIPLAVTKISSTERLRCLLPVQDGNKATWDGFEVKWVGAFNENSFLVMAELPFGWNVQRNWTEYLEQKSFTVLDASGIPKANVWMNMLQSDLRATVQLLSHDMQHASTVNLPQLSKKHLALDFSIFLD